MDFGIFYHGTPIPWVLVDPRHLQWCSLSEPVKKDFTSKFRYLLFFNPTDKTETGTGKGRGGTTTSKPPGLVNQWIIQNHRPPIVFMTLLFAGAHSHRKLCNYAEPKPFCLSQTGIFSVFFIQFYCAGSGAEPSWRCSSTHLPGRELDLYRDWT